MPKPAPRRQIPWRFLFSLAIWIIVFAGAALAARQARRFVLTDSHFALQPAIAMQGVQYASRARILQSFAPDFGHSAFTISLAERRRRLLAIDWVEDASLSRLWPNRLVLRVKERKPVAFVHMPGAKYLLIDREGVLLSPPPRARFNFPVLTGVSEDQTEPERHTRVVAMQEFLTALGSGASKISEVNVESLENLRVTTQIDRRGIELWMGDRNYESRYQKFLSNYPEISKTAEGAAIFDLRLDDRITTK